MTPSLRRPIDKGSKPLDMTVSVAVPFSSKPELKAVMNALIPDNVNFPKGLAMKMSSKGRNTLDIEITGKNVPVGTIIATLDEILEHISMAKKVIFR